MGGSRKKTPTLLDTEPKHGIMCAMLSKFSYYFTDSDGLDSHPSALGRSLLSVTMLPLPVEEKSFSLVIFCLCVHIPSHSKQQLLQSGASLLACSASSVQHLAINTDMNSIFALLQGKPLWLPTIQPQSTFTVTHTNFIL